MIFFENQEKNSIHFTKMHGLGNDYVVINCIDNQNKIEIHDRPKNARYLCNRNFGVGADGIILIENSTVANFKMSIYNKDGSEAQMCGNGIRCCAKYIKDNRLIDKEEIKIETLSGIKIAYVRKSEINKEIQEITIDMGVPIFENDKIPVILDKTEEKYIIPKVKLKGLENFNEVYCVSIGNPHAIVFCNNIDDINIEEIGKKIENDIHFPEKINVEFVKVLGVSSIKMRVWERGVGETFACGTGACAVAVICNKLGFTRKRSKVYLKGGELRIDIDDYQNSIYMTGIATKVFEGDIDIAI